MRRRQGTLADARREALTALMPLIHYTAKIWASSDPAVAFEIRELANRMYEIAKSGDAARLAAFWGMAD